MTLSDWKRDNRWRELVILSVALVLRLILLGIKPPHFDEGINGWWVDQMREIGYYRYDPENYHGPLHFYVLFLFLEIGGRNIWALRLPVVVAGVAAVWLACRFERFLGRATAQLAALTLALSPGMVFYNRYSIHETWLELFLMLTIYGVAGLWKEGKKSDLWLCAAGVVGMILTKETYVIHLAAMLLAIPTLFVVGRIRKSAPNPIARQEWSSRDLVAVIAAAVGTIVLFYSGTFLNFPMLSGLWETFGYWTKTGESGHGHEKPWYYWLKLFGRYEQTCAVGLACSFLLFFTRKPLVRYLAICGAGTLTGYSIVNYKTPWCVISLVWPFAFVFAEGMVHLGRYWNRKVATVLVVVLFAVQLALNIRLNFVEYTNPAEPYVYVQTFKDIEKISKPLLELARRNPENYHLTGSILTSSYYPLPWVLGDFDRIGYFGAGRVPQNPEADFLLINEADAPAIKKKLEDAYFVDRLVLREAQEPSELLLRYDTFKELFPGRLPEWSPE